ncbi:hypothetical protein YTPLAS18_38040 [Nitrospira sp.]|nr:hypothetical protein YTPLAS18_38040 [Nitrospira sp.]
MAARNTLRRSLGWAATLATVLLVMFAVSREPELTTHPSYLPASTQDESVPSATHVVPASRGEPERRTATHSSKIAPLPGVPTKAYEVFDAIQAREGEPLPGYVGGRTFENRERRLPRGRYREYDVNPRTRGEDRGAERLVIEQQTGKAYYTDDHYRSFTPIN